MTDTIHHRGRKPSFSLRERIDQGGWVIYRTMQFQEVTWSLLFIQPGEVAGQLPKILGLKTSMERSLPLRQKPLRERGRNSS